MTKSIFLRLLESPVETKGDHLRDQIAGINTNEQNENTFLNDPEEFSVIPNSTFAYWVSSQVRELFKVQPRFEQGGRIARVGDHPGNHDRYVRLFWEIPPKPRSRNRQWVPYQKGGVYSPYYADIHLVVDWDFERETYFDFHGRRGRTSNHPSNYQFFFRSGLTWPRRTQKGFNVRTLPEGCVFADKGPAIFVPDDNQAYLMALLSILNSEPFRFLVHLQMTFGSYEVGVIQQTPIPSLLSIDEERLTNLSQQALRLVREPALGNETTHVFCLPTILRFKKMNSSLSSCLQSFASNGTERKTQLKELQREIDYRVAELYGVPELLEPIDQETDEKEDDHEVDEDDEEEENLPENAEALVANLLMWCLGAAFGRWDVRFALDPSKLPELPGPFDPLPVSSPGMLVGSDGLPLPPNSSIPSYPISIAWDGVIVDHPSHPRDIVSNVRRVLQLLWEDKADYIETEACQILGVRDLRDYFRDPNKGFFDFHIKRYSKSRRKAPIYWLLQSSQRNYAIWLYYHRLTPDTLFHAAREYVDPKLNLETSRLEGLQSGLEAFSGSQLTRRERQIADQSSLVDEIKAFQKELDRVALLQLKPDLNDGVILNIAPLHQLVPWKEAGKYWGQLTRGRYEWSSIAQQQRQRGLVKGRS